MIPPRPRIIAIILISVVVVFSLWHFDVFHKPVEPVKELIGKDYAYALQHFNSKPISTSFNLNNDLNEFQGGVLSAKAELKDSMVHQHTWVFSSYKITIWIGKTERSENEIIDAFRYKNTVRF